MSEEKKIGAQKMRSEKVSILGEIIDRVKNSEFCFVLNYGGLKVDVLTALRKALSEQQSHLTIVKNTILGKVAKEQGWDDISAMLTGPTAIVTGKGDVSAVAKILVEFDKNNEQAGVKGANFEQKILSTEEIVDLSKLPDKDTMRATLLGTLNAPAQQFVRVLNASLLQVLYVLQAKADKEQ